MLTFLELCNANVQQRIKELEHDYGQTAEVLERCRKYNAELLQIIADAPHDPDCRRFYWESTTQEWFDEGIDEEGVVFMECDCWKSKLDEPLSHGDAGRDSET